ncbi:MAG: hypothetical protein FWE91_09370 [Defluviitaleaceae bacterium]|nr:hypothetical protein [Defluviitaleaceae bacterium]MCL2835739.1 hypothetical protein [Defluviitaleaceae bacterium]
MNRILWKLQNAGERLWLLANITAQQSATFEIEGLGLAVVAEETRKMAEKINELVERALFEEKEIQPGHLRDVAFMLNLLAFNSAIESHRMGWRGKPVAVCADDIRSLAYEITKLFDGNTNQLRRCVPLPKNRMTSVDRGIDYLRINIDGIAIAEPLINIKEICFAERTETHVKLRGMEVPLIDLYKQLGKTQDEPTYIILNTPWAAQNKTYAVTANVTYIFNSPIGIPTAAPPDTPLAGYIREYWESENGEPFLFLDWPKLTR